MIEIRKITTDEDLQQAFRVRRIVFMEEQMVSEADEFDGFEDNSVHYMGLYDQVPCGAARWRKTNEGIKLERFAVLPEFRGKGVGYALVDQVLRDARAADGGQPVRIYLNAQVDVVELYRKFGFKPVGAVFLECDIQHQQMELTD